jgi:hypothetical protein
MTTYTPLRNDFNELVGNVFPIGLTDEQRETLRMFFFAGAAAALGDQPRTPDQRATLIDELVDEAYRTAPSATKVA